MCYHCYTKNPGKYNWVKCRSFKNVPAHLCGDKPVDDHGNALTTSTTVTTTVTTLTTTVAATYDGTSMETTTITLPATTTLPTPEAELAERSWHKEVHFRLPWGDGRRMCADAEWDKRGKDDWEVRLQDVHADDGDDCNGVIDLDLADMILVTATSTVGVIETDTLTGWTAFSTSTATVYTSHVTTIVVEAATEAATTSASTSSLEPVVVEIITPITVETDASVVITVTTSSTIFPDTAATTETAAARAEAPPHRDL